MPSSADLSGLPNANAESLHFSCAISQSQRFRKGVGGQSGLARGDPSYARNSGLFSVPFFLCPLRRRETHFWRTFCSKPLTIAPLPPVVALNRSSKLQIAARYRGNQSIYLHCGGPLLENGLATGQRIAMVDMVFLVFTASFSYLP